MKQGKGLLKEELIKLDGLYFSYFKVDCYGVADLARLHYLETLATDAQLRRLLKKYGRTLESEFING